MHPPKLTGVAVAQVGAVGEVKITWVCLSTSALVGWLVTPPSVGGETIVRSLEKRKSKYFPAVDSFDGLADQGLAKLLDVIFNRLP